jgi:hypothetical protein
MHRTPQLKKYPPGGSQYEPEQKYKEKESTKEREVSERGGVAPALTASGYRLEDAARHTILTDRKW